MRPYIGICLRSAHKINVEHLTSKFLNGIIQMKIPLLRQETLFACLYPLLLTMPGCSNSSETNRSGYVRFLRLLKTSPFRSIYLRHTH